MNKDDVFTKKVRGRPKGSLSKKTKIEKCLLPPELKLHKKFHDTLMKIQLINQILSSNDIRICGGGHCISIEELNDMSLITKSLNEKILSLKKEANSEIEVFANRAENVS